LFCGDFELTELHTGGIHHYLNGGLETADVSVVMCSLPTRPDLLSEAIHGVVSQSVKPKAAYIGIDFALIGEAQNQNRLASLVDTKWMAFCHDDDIWLPNHLEVMLAHSEDTDVVFTNYILEGRGDWHPGHWCHNWRMLLETNWIPPTACMIKTSVFNEVGGWEPLTHPRDWVDWKMWRKLYNEGYTLKCTCTKTFRYRFNVREGHNNGSI
jgi:hypothetical protein